MKFLTLLAALPCIIALSLAIPSSSNSTAVKRGQFTDDELVNWRIELWSEKDCKGTMQAFANDRSGVGYCKSVSNYKSYHVIGMDKSATCFAMFFDKGNTCLARTVWLPEIKSKGTNFEAIDRGCRNAPNKKGKNSFQVMCGRDVGQALKTAAMVELAVQPRNLDETSDPPEGGNGDKTV